MIKQYKNFLSGSIFTAIDIDIATAKYIGILEDSNGMTFKTMMSPSELSASNYYEI